MTVALQARAGSPSRRWWALTAVCLGQFMLMVDVTVILVALPEVSRDLGTSFDDVQWIVDAYALALAAFLLNAGALADRCGRRRMFTIGLAVFGVSSGLCGIAWSPGVLIAARAIQGLGGAVLLSTGLAIIGQEFTGRDRATALGIFGAVYGAAIAIGPLLAGLLIELAGWRSIFLINLPVAAVAVLVARRHINEQRDSAPRPTDIGGQLLFTAGIVMLVAGLVRGEAWGWGSARIVALLGGAALALAGFLVAEHLQRRPMFDLALLRDRSFVGASIAAFATTASLFGMFVYLTFYLQAVDGRSALQTGVLFLPVTIVAFVAAATAGRLSDRVSARLMLGGALSCSTVGLLQMTMLDAGEPWTVLLPGLVLVGLGFGVANPTVAAVTLVVSPPDRAATATGMNSTFRQVGIAAGVAGMGALFEHHLVERLGPGIADSLTPTNQAAALGSRHQVVVAFVDGLDVVFLAGAAVALVGAVAAITCVRVTSSTPT